MNIRLRGPAESLGTGRLAPELDTWHLERRPKKVDGELFAQWRSAVSLDEELNLLLPSTDLRASFIDNTELAKGREESRHQVRFGQLIVNGPGVHEAPMLVAVKPFELRKNLYNEWAASAYVNGLFDEQRAFLPIGIAKDEEGTMSMISMYEHGVQTADKIFWADKQVTPEALRQKVVEDTAATCMRGLGLMHGSRIIHGDTRAKNMGNDLRNERLVDLEDAALIPKDAVDEAEFTDKLAKDIAMFIDSCFQVEENKEQIAETLQKERVIKRLLHSYKQGVDHARQLQDTHIPNYDKMHEELIRDLLGRV